MTPGQMCEASRNADGRIDTARLFRMLLDARYSRGAAVQHLVEAGCPEELAWQRFYETV